MKKRKKEIILLSLLFFVISYFALINVKAETTTLTKSDSGWYWSRTYNNVYNSWHWSFYNFGERIAYCVEPTIPEGSEYNLGTWDNSSLSNDIKIQMLLTAYYGYDYPNHQTINYRAATQALLWQAAGTSSIIFSSERYEKGTIYDVSKEQNEILSLVSNHYKKPTFNNETIEAKVGQKITLYDNNNVLKDYEVETNNEAEIIVINNKIEITPKVIGKINLSLRKKIYTSKQYMVYYNATKQTMLASGAVDPVYANLTIDSKGGIVEINKVDKDTNSSTGIGEATLSGAVYGIYNSINDELIEKVITNENGYMKSNNLPYFGNFYLQEITSSKGYQLDTTKYYFSSNIENVNAKLKVQEKVINRNYDFTKVYADAETKIMTPEPNVEFGFYNSKGILYRKAITDSNGRLVINLIYGSYIVKQLTSTTNYEKLKDFKIDVQNSGDTVYRVLSNAEIKAKLKVIKVDKENGNIIKRSGIKFKIKNLSTKEYICQNITYPKEQKVCDFETDENGAFITPYELNSGLYQLEEIDQKIDGYLWNKESQLFEIGENSQLITDDNYGILFETKFTNDEVKGQVDINKTGENITYTDNSYLYDTIKLEGAEFRLFASEDIYSANGILKFRKNSLVATIITDKNGMASVKDLYLGKYYLIEIKSAHNNVIDTNKYKIELKYKDQYTKIIKTSLELKNHLAKGVLEFTKTDFSTSISLPNTIIEIYTNDDKLIYSGKTNLNGKIIIDNLPIGKYYLLEKEAPDGYTINTEKMNFEIIKDGQIFKATMKDNKIIEVPDTEKNDYAIIEILLCVIGFGFVIYVKKKK